MGTRDGRGAGQTGREKQSDEEEEEEEEDFVIEFFSSDTDKNYECDLTNTDRERESAKRGYGERTDDTLLLGPLSLRIFATVSLYRSLSFLLKR